MSDLIQTISPTQIATASTPIITTEAQINLTVNRISELVEVLSPQTVAVLQANNSIVVNAPGPIGATGATGPRGIAGGNLTQLVELDDVLIINLQNGQLLKYNTPLAQWVNSDYLDGGNF